jgi:hypothetical protein
MISVQAQIEIQGDLNLANISQEIEKLNFPKEILKTANNKPSKRTNTRPLRPNIPKKPKTNNTPESRKPQKNPKHTDSAQDWLWIC